MIDYLRDRVDMKIFFICWLVFTLLLMSLIHYLNTGKTDSIYEEIAEDIIEFNTGISIDLSPETGFYP